MFRLIQLVRSRYSRSTQDRGGVILEYGVVFAIVAIVAAILIGAFESDFGEQIRGGIGSAISTALGGEGGGADAGDGGDGDGDGDGDDEDGEG